jgi:hypothetical protein
MDFVLKRRLRNVHSKDGNDAVDQIIAIKQPEFNH